LTDDQTVEALLQRIDGVAEGLARLELWVPTRLTFRGVHVPSDVAMAMVLDRLLSMGFMPSGFSQGDDGRTYYHDRQGPS
jgi:hypothetical protein